MNPYLIAIDPGVKGAIAWREPGGRLGVANLEVAPADIYRQIIDLPGAPCENMICFLEEVSGFAGKPQPGSAMFRFGRAVGLVEGILAALKIEVRRIRPQRWQKFLSALSRPGEDKWSHKRRLRALALELYPIFTKGITLQTADALLMLHVAEAIVCEKE